jgi:hypothetical protein
MAGKASKLKVYTTQIGFNCVVVAAPNQKAALEAWDVKKNLFADGSAHLSKDPKAIELALATPGKPIAMKTNVVSLDDHPKRRASKSRPTAPKAHPKAHPKTKPKPRKRNRAPLDKAEAALADFKKRALRERAALRRQLQKLEDDLEALREKGEQLDVDLEAEKEALEAAVEEARDQFEADAS